jgi:hypothetical protein
MRSTTSSSLPSTAEEYRIEYIQIWPREAIAWSRPKEVHLGLTDAAIPTFQTGAALLQGRTDAGDDIDLIA